MMENRKGEDGNVPFRCERTYCVGNEWFFTTREGTEEGPYESKDEAEVELAFYMRERNSIYKQIS